VYVLYFRMTGIPYGLYYVVHWQTKLDLNLLMIDFTLHGHDSVTVFHVVMSVTRANTAT
jgi:hypothetical protein